MKVWHKVTYYNEYINIMNHPEWKEGEDPDIDEELKDKCHLMQIQRIAEPFPEDKPYEWFDDFREVNPPPS